MSRLAQMPVHGCTACDAQGGETTEDGVWWQCEGCEGSGATTSCRECGDPMPLPEADREGYRCPLCLDAEDRAAREVSLQGRFG